MRFQGGLKAEDWRRWGQFTTFKTNAAELVQESLRGDEIVYCSPLVDPYQPAEDNERMMPRVLEALLKAERPPRVFTIQTRGPGVLRDLPLLARLAGTMDVRVSFSLTTNRDEVRRWYEPHCATLEERLRAVRTLQEHGIRTFATLAPLLPCDPEMLARQAIEATRENVIGDPFHVRIVKRHGATTRPEAEKVSRVHGFERWHEPEFQREVVMRIGAVVHAAGREFAVGTEGFRWLAS